MVKRQLHLHLPLVHHLVKHSTLDFFPGMPADVGSADSDFDGFVCTRINGQLAQPGFHSAGQAKGDFRQTAFEVPLVEPLVRQRELVKQAEITGSRTLPPGLARGAFRPEKIDRKGEERMLQCLPQAPGYPWTEKAHDSLEDTIRRQDVPLMNAKHAIAEGEHDHAITVRSYRRDTLQPECLQPLPENHFGRMGQSGWRFHCLAGCSTTSRGPGR